VRRLAAQITQTDLLQQFGEVVAVMDFFKGRQSGFFVDVGAHHPRCLSNTFALHRKGWCGVNIDLHRHNIALFNIVRPSDVNVCAAISSEERDLSLFEFAPISVYNTLSREDADTVKREKGLAYSIRTVRTRTLDSVLAEHGFSDRQIDFLSVDVEGHDLEVLRSLDFDLHKPTLVCVELHEPDIRKIIDNPLYKFVTDRGYRLFAWPKPSLLFAREVTA
jgi:FkbM family methyltransferase